MRLATQSDGRADGRLVVVSRDSRAMVPADNIAPTLQSALESWDVAGARLRELYDSLNAGTVANATEYRSEQMSAPLPRAWQWLDGSAFASHGELMQKAFDLPPIATDAPLMYQGMSHTFLGPVADVPLPSEEDGIDFEGEFGVVTDFVPMGTGASDCLRHICLVVQINDWSLRVIAPREMKTGFGWIQAKPACSMAPVAVTPDELGDFWQAGRLTGHLRVEVNSVEFGDVAATEMRFGFHELIAYAARTRDLCAGTLVGSGTVSSQRFRETGSCCIAERRAIEMIDHGAARTPYLRFGDQVRMTTRLGGDGGSPFGEMNQKVIAARVPKAGSC
jgi:fumarylacetoacetate (FAA) hydrolase